MSRAFLSLVFLTVAQVSWAAPIATAQSFGYSGQQAADYNRSVASLASSSCDALASTISANSGAENGSPKAIRKDAASALARAKGC